MSGWIWTFRRGSNDLGIALEFKGSGNIRLEFRIQETGFRTGFMISDFVFALKVFSHMKDIGWLCSQDFWNRRL